MKLLESITHARKELHRKTLLFNEAYIFVLESELLSIAKLETEEPEDIFRTIQGSYLRFHEHLKENNLQMKPMEFYRSILFIDLVSSMEIFLTDVVKAILIAYPKKLSGSKVELKEIVEGVTVDELVERKADEEIYRLMYEKPEDYLKKICTILSIESKQIEPFWPYYIEAKARRDVGVHNNWKCNETYLRKTAKLDFEISQKIGGSLVPSNTEYCNKVHDNIIFIANEIADQILEKHS